ARGLGDHRRQRAALVDAAIEAADVPRRQVSGADMIHGAGIGAGAAKQRRWPRWGITLHISTGQSLSVGALDPVATTEQPYGNLRLVDSRGIFSGYVLTDPTNANLSL